MKRCISLILALILFCPALFSCGDEKEIDNSTDAPSEEKIMKRQVLSFLHPSHLRIINQPTIYWWGMCLTE